jgi:hypothetical protein
MYHDRGNATDAGGNQADPRSAARGCLSGRLGSGLVGIFLQPRSNRCCVLRAIRKRIYGGSTPRTDHTLADGACREIQRAGQPAGSRRGRDGSNLAAIKTRIESRGTSRPGTDRLHASLAQSRGVCSDRRHADALAQGAGLVQDHAGQPVSLASQHRRADELQRLQSRRDGTAGRFVWLATVFALLSRHCLPGRYASSQSRRQFGPTGRAGFYGASILEDYRILSTQGQRLAVVPAVRCDNWLSSLTAGISIGLTSALRTWPGRSRVRSSLHDGSMTATYRRTADADPP